MTYLRTPKMPGEDDVIRWIDVLREVNHQRANTFADPWAAGETVDGRTFEEYPAHFIVYDEGDGPEAGVYLIAKNADGARVLRYAAFELSQDRGLPCPVMEADAPVDLTPKEKVVLASK